MVEEDRQAQTATSERRGIEDLATAAAGDGMMTRDLATANCRRRIGNIVTVLRTPCLALPCLILSLGRVTKDTVQ